ncbi:hypothetical protein D593_1033 [Streptococcus intermedius BA1]|nr:hypothetical protein D593_1033 [Streptococcus intermedius BA1]
MFSSNKKEALSNLHHGIIAISIDDTFTPLSPKIIFLC